MPGVKLEKLRKTFGKNEVLKGIDLDIADGEFVVLLGPSGSGKTTTLRIIAGLETQDSGHVYIGDKLVDDLPPRDRNVSMVFQNYALYPHKTVRENIAMPLLAKKLPRGEIENRVERISETLGISDLLDRYPRQLSGGQQQRVALARALVKEPSVFLMDEPLSNLDAKLRVSTRTFLKSLQRHLRITTVYVTHDQSEAMALADRVALISDGVIQQVDPPEDLYNYPNNEFVAGFIGSPPINVVKGKLANGSVRFLGREVRLEAIAERRAEALGKGRGDAETDAEREGEKEGEGEGRERQEGGEKEVTVGVRPEDVIIGEPSGIEAQVLVVEPLGSEKIVTLKVEGEELKARVLGESEVKEGESTKVGIKKFMVFYGGQRIWPLAPREVAAAGRTRGKSRVK